MRQSRSKRIKKGLKAQSPGTALRSASVRLAAGAVPLVPINHAMVAAINEVGHVMGIKTIAEYVETAEVLAAVKAIGIDFAQGYAISALQPLASYAG